MNPAESGSNLPLIPFPKYIEILPNIHKSEKQNTEESKLSKEDTINFIILRSQHTILKPEIQLILEIYENFIKDLNVVKYNLKTIETLETPEISDTSETLESFETQGNHDIKNRSEGSRNNGVLLHIVKETEFGDLDIPPKKGAYHVLKKQNMIHITALDVDGIFYGLQTFRQLVMFYGRLQNVPLCEIKDWPDFPIRGFMHDVGRNFIPINRLKQDIRIMAQYKLNTFHWHLTENEAWRIESKCFPELNNSQNHKSTRDPGKYYTYGEMRDFITYCN